MRNKINLKTFDNLKLDVGCGVRKRAGFIGLDCVDSGQEIVWDIMHGIPLPDNSTLEIYCDNVLEHIPTIPADSLLFVMYEFYRICRSNAMITIIVPHADSQAAWQDPTHQRIINTRSHLYWSTKTPWAAYYGYPMNLQLLSQEVKGDMKTEAFLHIKLKVVK